MKPERLESLLWEHRDGEIAVDEQDVLGTYIDEHPEANALQKEIETLAERLDNLGVAVPPRDLRSRIDEALAGVPIPGATPEPLPRPATFKSSRRPATSWLPLAASLLIGVTIGYLLQPGASPFIEPAKVAGTMNTSAVGPAAETIRIALGMPSSSVEVSRHGELLSMGIHLENSADLEVDVEVPTGFLLVTGINADDPTGVDVTSAEGRTVLRTRGPTSQMIEITATAGSVPVRLTVRENGVVVADDWFTGKPGSEGG